MKRVHHLSINGFHVVAAVVLFASVRVALPASAQEQNDESVNQIDIEYLNRGLVEDWSTRHVVFSNPGTLEDARRNGREEDWRRIVSDPRYRMQWVRRYAAGAGLTADHKSRDQDRDWYRERIKRDVTLHGDWAVTIGASGASVAIDMSPAKFTFNPLFPPDCTNDFVVFPVANSASSGANLVGVNNLYSGTCTTGTVPNVLFAYNVGTGSVQTSPVLSENGTKVAFIESKTSGASIFHVLTLDKRGNSGCATSTSPCNGTAYNSPAVPGTNNAAVDTKITLNGNGSSNVPVTRSSPFVDYTNDIAYVGDDNGNLHKITNVFGIFGGTPAEVVISGYWPACTGTFTTSCTGAPVLSSPVVDGCATTGSSSPPPTCPGGAYGSGLMLIGGSTGTLYGDPTSYGGYSGFSGIGGYNFTSKAASVGSTVLDAPILDGTTEKVFVATTKGSNLAVAQLSISPTASSSTSSTPFVSTTPITATTGASGTDAYNGAFDNAYLSSGTSTTGGTGYMYFCGNLTGAATPALWRVAITTGTMSSSNDGNFFQLVASGNTGTNYDCTPLTEFYNSTSNTDYLFVGVKNSGAPSGCASSSCVMSFSLPTASPFTFPSGVISATSIPSSSTLASNGMSGFIIDDSSGRAGASEIYFGNLFAGTGVQMSQSALK